jgi:hypothetical protein
VSHATDSQRSGWTANKSAASAAAIVRALSLAPRTADSNNLRAAKNNATAASACNNTFVAWKWPAWGASRPGLKPHSAWSIAYESQLSGWYGPMWLVVNIHSSCCAPSPRKFWTLRM